MSENTRLTFSKYFEIDKKILEQKGFYDISLISDLPLFIDPFHLFYSDNEEYKKLHDEIIKYLSFLRKKSVENSGNTLSSGIINAYYKFPEVKQNWFGFSSMGNKGRGLGKKFAITLNLNFYKFFNNFGTQTGANHLEKLILISKGVGKDTISDFTTNLIQGYLAKKTEFFAQKYINGNKLAKFTIKKAAFDYDGEAWIPKTFYLPVIDNNYVLLTPKNLLTGDDVWINRRDLEKNFSDIPQSAPNDALREQLSSYFKKKLLEYAEVKEDKKTGNQGLSITKKTKIKAAIDTIAKFPQTVDIYIKIKENKGAEAEIKSKILVTGTETIYKNQFTKFVEKINLPAAEPTSYADAHARAIFFKECIELRDNYLNLYIGDKPVDEGWVQRMFWFVWFGSHNDVNRDPSNGLGKPDFAISKGKKDKTLVEFKLAKSSSLEKNLLKQLAKYQEVDKVKKGIWVIIFFNESEEAKIKNILKKYKLEDDEKYVLVDARKDNKTSASKL